MACALVTSGAKGTRDQERGRQRGEGWEEGVTEDRQPTDIHHRLSGCRGSRGLGLQRRRVMAAAGAVERTPDSDEDWVQPRSDNRSKEAPSRRVER